ncbi:MAG: putative CAMK family protein kinase [Streblomastix strix]|uniref:Putative CAMK family protein kinase n=1 Tax=Streblomastix strix TaxID=222440 RepID=A0A5J4UQ43_9EUKA|nr:MAG: putative CAMK family protein kinase [Streblomastix strix]
MINIFCTSHLFGIGQGAFGKVFLAYSQGLIYLGLVAAKVMRSAQDNVIPFIVQFKLVKQGPEYTIILLEFCNFKSLDSIIKRNYQLTPGTLRAIAKQLFEGLRIIHAKGLVHRDIKGENLMMQCPPGSNRVIVKIADFGLVKDQGALQQTMLMSAKGTPLNMAPELVIGDGRASAKVDVWSAGVVIYQLAYHEYPIKAGSIQDLMKLMQQQKISRPAVIKDNLLWNFICHCLNFDRTQRYSAEQALQDPYFIGPQAQQEISQEARQIAVQLQLAQQNGDKSVTIYDINPSFTVPKTEIKAAISYDPDVDLQAIYAQIPNQVAFLLVFNLK